MVPIFSILLSACGFALLLLGGYIIYRGIHDSDDESIIVIGAFIIFGTLIFPASVIYSHTQNIITLDLNTQHLAIYTARAKALNKEFKTLDGALSNFANADSPIASIVKAKVDTVDKITEVELERFEAIQSIERRKLGGFWWVPYVYPATYD